MRHGGESLLVHIVANQREQTVEAFFNGHVLYTVLVLRYLRLVGVGQEVHEQEHQQMQRFSVNFVKIQTSDSQIFQVKFIIQNSTLTGKSAHGVCIISVS